MPANRGPARTLNFSNLQMAQSMKIFGSIGRYPKFHLQNLGLYKSLSSFSSKDLTKPSVTFQNATIADHLLQNLKNSTNPQQVLQIVGDHHKVMNSKQLLQALRSLFILQKYSNSNISTSHITSHPYFEKLCHHLKIEAGTIDSNDAIEALKILSFIGVSSKSTIIQVLLQLLRHNVNELSLQCIIFLDFILKQFKSSPLVDGLLIALPIVFEVHLPIKMDRENIAHMADCFQYISKKRVSAKCVELVVDTILNYIDKHKKVEPKVAKSIIWSICDLESDEYFEPLLKQTMACLLESDIDALDYQEVNMLLTKLCYKYSVKHPFYYSDTFIDACVNYIVDKNVGFQKAVQAFRKLLRVSHTNDNLLNYIARLCHNNPNILEKASALEMYVIANAVALSEYRPTYWDELKEALLATKCFESCRKDEILWLKLCASLCALDIYKRDILERSLDESYLEEILNQNYAVDFESFLLINQAISTLEPDFKYLLPSKSIADSLRAKIRSVLEYPLEGPLHRALGGENYFKTCVKTELGLHIDHVVVMRRGGYPISISKMNIQYLEELQVPHDSHIVLILALGPLCYSMNTRRLKATSSLMIRTLEAKGYTVVPICMDVWNSIADFEKIPYLMQAIRSKLESNEVATNVVC